MCPDRWIVWKRSSGDWFIGRWTPHEEYPREVIPVGTTAEDVTTAKAVAAELNKIAVKVFYAERDRRLRTSMDTERRKIR